MYGVTRKKERDSTAPVYGNQVPGPSSPTLPPTATLCPRHLLIHLFLRLEIPENPQSVIMHGSQETQVKFENGSKFESESHSVVSSSLQPRGLYSPWNSPGQNTGVGSLSLLRRIVPTEGSNPGLLHCWQSLYQRSHKESPRILE